MERVLSIIIFVSSIKSVFKRNHYIRVLNTIVRLKNITIAMITIIGATSDLAKAMAYEYAILGKDLILLARNHSRLIPLQKDIQIRHNINVELVEFDVLETEKFDTILTPIITKTDTAIYAAGILGNQGAEQVEDDKAILNIQVNYTAGVLILQKFAQAFEAKKGGTIIGISSVAGVRGRQSNYIYGSAKAGFTAFLSGLRNRMVKHNVHVVSVIPGYLDTKMVEHLTLPKPLTASPKVAAQKIVKAANRKSNTVYVLPIWRWIMLIIRHIPEFIFKKLNL